ncbi:Tetratricopeptide repeat protein [Planctomycetes bacterium Pla163]|uniref:Tetratricopeptide repeat protein n=1 Tax=Rohdeia mirabilis TaxID=2528008 RepID=A0A518CYI2_9BACT|nr:Tetratricopeptide repeat protein [Planctomycetes bacterium Pla163]
MRTHATHRTILARTATRVALVAALAGPLTAEAVTAAAGPAQEPAPEDAPTTEESTDDSVAGAAANAALELQMERATRLAELASLLDLGLVSDALELGLPLVAAGPPPGPLVDDGRAIALVARALDDAGRGDEARDLLIAANVIPATGPWIELEWARLDLVQDELDSALRRLVREDGTLRLPDFPQAWMLTGRALARRGSLGAAARYLNGYLERAPYAPDTVSALHILHLEALQRRDAEAATALLAESERRRRAFELIRARSLQVRANPKDALPRYGLGLAYLELGDTRAATAALEELVELQPDFARAYFQLGEARRLSGDREGAVLAFGEGLARDPDDHKCRLNRGLVLGQLARYDEALTDLEFLLRSDVAGTAEYAGIYLGLARVYDRTERPEAADQAYAKYRELGGDQPR